MASPSVLSAEALSVPLSAESPAGLPVLAAGRSVKRHVWDDTRRQHSRTATVRSCRGQEQRVLNKSRLLHASQRTEGIRQANEGVCVECFHVKV